IGWSAEQWLTRFDVPSDELMAYKAKLLDEPRLEVRPSGTPPSSGSLFRALAMRRLIRTIPT
ncbi:MAG: hypothetical protein EOO38_10480, partial [Cytophagaceae bacterium]